MRLVVALGVLGLLVVQVVELLVASAVERLDVLAVDSSVVAEHIAAALQALMVADIQFDSASLRLDYPMLAVRNPYRFDCLLGPGQQLLQLLLQWLTRLLSHRQLIRYWMI